MKLHTLLLVMLGTVTLLLGAGFWYVFIADAPQLDAPEITANTGLNFQLETFDSQSMQETRQYGVILPPGYAQSPQQHYPVIFLLHGGHDDARAFYNKYGITDVLHQLYQEKKLPASIVIMPDGNDRRGSSPLWDSQYYDGPEGKVGTLIGSELVQLVRSRYRTLDQPQFWAIGGISSGGWGAFNIGLRHLDSFNIFFSHSGYFTDRSGAANSPNSFIGQLPASDLHRIRVYLDAGESDTDLLASTEQFNQTLDRLDVSHEFHAFPGGHGITGADFGWNYFRKHLNNSLSYVGVQFQQALDDRVKLR